MKGRKIVQPRKGEIHLTPFPFTDLSHNKLRPCVVIGCDKDDIVVVFLTTVKPKQGAYIEVNPSKENRLKVVSYARYTKIATLDARMSLGQIGILETVLYKDLTQAITGFLM